MTQTILQQIDPEELKKNEAPKAVYDLLAKYIVDISQKLAQEKNAEFLAARDKFEQILRFYPPSEASKYFSIYN